MDCTVVAADEQSEIAIDVDRWSGLAAAAASYLGLSGELTLNFIDVDEISALNAEFMDASGPTDVLAFPLDSVDASGVGPGRDPSPSVFDRTDRTLLLGDIVICPAVARDQAPDHAGTLDDELALLVVHGLLHLIGHDHALDEQAREMRALERDLLERFHWDGPAPDDFSFDHR
jgi:probable rRNA maturation factor